VIKAKGMEPGWSAGPKCSLAPTKWSVLLRCMSPLLAQSGHELVHRTCLLLTQADIARFSMILFEVW